MMANVRKATAVERLQKLVDEASELDPEDHRTRKFMNWTAGVNSAFHHIFGEDSRQYSQLPNGYKVSASGIRDFLNTMVSAVESNLDDLKYVWDDDGKSAATPMGQGMISAYDEGGDDKVDKKAERNRVFVIHGHDDAVRETVARCLERLELEPVILHEQPDKGRTIIEKFEDHADVGIAAVLLTPDDEGVLAGTGEGPKPRARQNVILELGFFLGRLGLERGFSLVKGDVETPSDHDGVVHTGFDSGGGWMAKLAQELKAAGFVIDVSRAVQS